MGILQDKQNVLKGVANKSVEGARYAKNMHDVLEQLAAEVNTQLAGSATGERAAFILNDAASELNDVASALQEAESKMATYSARLAS